MPVASLLSCSNNALPPVFSQLGNFENLAYITGENHRYIQPFVAEVRHGCQGGGWDNPRLCQVEAENALVFALPCIN